MEGAAGTVAFEPVLACPKRCKAACPALNSVMSRLGGIVNREGALPVAGTGAELGAGTGALNVGVLPGAGAPEVGALLGAPNVGMLLGAEAPKVGVLLGPLKPGALPAAAAGGAAVGAAVGAAAGPAVGVEAACPNWNPRLAAGAARRAGAKPAPAPGSVGCCSGLAAPAPAAKGGIAAGGGVPMARPKAASVGAPPGRVKGAEPKLDPSPRFCLQGSMRRSGLNQVRNTLAYT